MHPLLASTLLLASGVLLECSATMVKAENSFQAILVPEGCRFEGKCWFWYEFPLSIEQVSSPGLERVVDLVSKLFAAFAELFQIRSANGRHDLADLQGDPSINFFQRRPAAHHQIPDGYLQLAANSSDGQVQRAFAREQLFAPLRQGMGGAHDGLC